MPVEIPQEIVDTLNHAQQAQLVLIQGYLEWMEQAGTLEVCACEWIIHPDDLEKASGKRRMMRTTEDHPLCPVHTKAGFLFYFINKYPHMTLDAAS